MPSGFVAAAISRVIEMSACDRVGSPSAHSCDRRPTTDEISGKRLQAIKLAIEPVIPDRHILAFDKAGLGKAVAECGAPLRGRVGRAHVEQSDKRQPLLQCARCKRPGRRASEKREA